MTKILHAAWPRRRGIQAVRAEGQPTDVKALIAELNKTFADFRTANDERVAALEKGKADVVAEEKVDKINAAVTDLQAKLDEAMASLAHLQLGGTAEDPKAAAQLETQARVFFAAVRGVEPERVTTEDIDGYKAYAAAFPSYLRRGAQAARMPTDFQASLSVGSDPDGGYWVPGEMQSTIITRLFETSPMRQMADVIQITSDSITWPNDTNDGTSGGWVGETETRSETATPEVGEQTIYAREQYAMPIATQKLLDMASIDVEAWLAAKIADKLARTENTAFVSGTGVASPRGFLDYKSAAVTADDTSRAWGKLQYVPSGASAGFPTVSGSSASDPDALITIVEKLKPAYRAGANWTMARSVEASIRKLKDADGNYLIGRLDSNTTGFSLLGFPIATAEDMPALGADSFSVAFGNFRLGYQIVDGRGLRVLRDNLTTKGKVKFYTTKWTGGDVVNFDAIKLMKFATS